MGEWWHWYSEKILGCEKSLFNKTSSILVALDLSRIILIGVLSTLGIIALILVLLVAAYFWWRHKRSQLEFVEPTDENETSSGSLKFQQLLESQQQEQLLLEQQKQQQQQQQQQSGAKNINQKLNGFLNLKTPLIGYVVHKLTHSLSLSLFLTFFHKENLLIFQSILYDRKKIYILFLNVSVKGRQKTINWMTVKTVDGTCQRDWFSCA